jgi:DNA-binding NarL/FixJ family response regulator
LGRAVARDGGQVRIVIATEPAFLRDVLATCLDQEERLEVAAEGPDEDQTVHILRKVSPELLLFDYKALGANSESIIARLRHLASRTRILVIATRLRFFCAPRLTRSLAAKVLGTRWLTS